MITIEFTEDELKVVNTTLDYGGERFINVLYDEGDDAGAEHAEQMLLQAGVKIEKALKK